MRIQVYIKNYYELKVYILYYFFIKNIQINPLTSPGERVSVFKYLYLNAGVTVVGIKDSNSSTC